MFSGDFCGGYGDFETLFHDVDLDKYCIRFWYHPDNEPEGSETLFYKKIVGYTLLPTDILLHLVSVENVDDISDNAELVKENGVQFYLLSRLCGRHGFEIIPEDQNF